MRDKMFLLVLFTMLSGMSFAENNEVKISVNGLNFLCNLKNQTAKVVKQEGDEYGSLKKVEIPETVTAEETVCTVIEIDEGAFNECTGIRTISLPSNLKKIGNSAFYDCWRVTTLKFPDDLEEIGSNAFFSVNLKEAILPEGMKVIGEAAFHDCENMKKLVLPSTITSIGNMAFYGTGLNFVVSRISEPFAIQDVVFGYDKPKAVLCVPIGSRQKYVDTDYWNKFACILEGNDLGDVTQDGLDYTYAIGSNTAVLKAGEYNNFETLNIPSKIAVDDAEYVVVEIAPRAFFSCELKEVILNEGMERIGELAFYDNYTLKKLVLPSTLKQVGEKAFYECDNINTIISYMDNPIDITDLEAFSFYGYSDQESNFHAYGPEGISFGAVLYVPKGCIPAYKTTEVWKNFTIIFEGEPLGATVDGINYTCSTISRQAIVETGNYEEMDAIVIPDSITVNDVKYAVTIIGEEAFSNLRNIQSITLSDSIQIIGTNAFYCCYSMADFKFPKNLRIIGGSAFSDCRFETIDIPEGVEAIGRYAFRGCYPQIVRLPSTLKRIHESIALGTPDIIVSKMKEPCMWLNPNPYDDFVLPDIGRLYVPKGAKNAYADTQPWSQIGNILEGDVGYAYAGELKYFWESGNNTALVASGKYSSMESVNIPESVKIDGATYTVTGIGESAFQNCTSLTSVVLPSSIKIIEDGAFFRCTSLTSFNLPEGLQKIGGYAFYECYSMTEVNFPSSLRIIGGRSFFNTCIKKLIIPNGVQKIEDNAFESCRELEVVEFPAFLEKIGDGAFMDCDIEKFKKVISHIKYPFPVDKSTFEMRSYSNTQFTNAELHVPKGTLEEYQSYPCWNEFKTIIDDLPEELGDVNDDYMVDINDFMLIFRYIYGDTSLKVKENDDDADYDINFYEADMNGDNKIDIADLVMLANKLLK